MIDIKDVAIDWEAVKDIQNCTSDSDTLNAIVAVLTDVINYLEEREETK